MLRRLKQKQTTWEWSKHIQIQYNEESVQVMLTVDSGKLTNPSKPYESNLEIGLGVGDRGAFQSCKENVAILYVAEKNSKDKSEASPYCL